MHWLQQPRQFGTNGSRVPPRPCTRSRASTQQSQARPAWGAGSGAAPRHGHLRATAERATTLQPIRLGHSRNISPFASAALSNHSTRHCHQPTLLPPADPPSKAWPDARPVCFDAVQSVAHHTRSAAITDPGLPTEESGRMGRGCRAHPPELVLSLESNDHRLPTAHPSCIPPSFIGVGSCWCGRLPRHDTVARMHRPINYARMALVTAHGHSPWSQPCMLLRHSTDTIAAALVAALQQC
jgi:hypothetical protein